MNENGKKWPVVSQGAFDRFWWVRARLRMRLSAPGDPIGDHSRPRNLSWVARQSLKLQPDQADPCRAMLIGGIDFPFPDSRPVAGREVRGMGEIPGPAESGPSALEANARC